MAVANYKCIKCGSKATGSSHPLVGKCSSDGGHEWVLEDRSVKNFKCIKCGSKFTGFSHPIVGKCSKGDGHEWRA